MAPSTKSELETETETLETNTASWDRHAARYRDGAGLSLDEVDFGDPIFPTERDLQLIGEVKGKRVVEVGSGGCNCGIAMARRGADVTCLDVSVRQLEIGREQAERAGVRISTMLADATQVDTCTNGVFDLAIAIASFQYVPRLQLALASIFRALAPGGRLVFSVPHPFMDALDASVLSPETGADPNYTYRGPVRWKWHKGDTFEFVTQRRTVADYLNSVLAAGFLIDRVEELLPNRAESDWSEVEHEVRTRFPSFLVIAAHR